MWLQTVVPVVEALTSLMSQAEIWELIPKIIPLITLIIPISTLPDNYPLVICSIAIEHGLFEIVDFPLYNSMGIFHSFLYVYQRIIPMNFWIFHLSVWWTCLWQAEVDQWPAQRASFGPLSLGLMGCSNHPPKKWIDICKIRIVYDDSLLL